MSNASDLRSLAEEMAAAYTQRKQDVARVVSDAKELITDAAAQDRERTEENKKLMAEAGKARANEVADLKASADALVKDMGKQNADLKVATGALLSDYVEADEKRAEENKKFMAEAAKQDEARASEVADLKAATGALLSDYAEADKARSNEVADLKGSADSLVAEFHAEQAETKAAWQSLLGMMRNVRGGKAPKAPRKARVEAKPPVAEELAEHIEEELTPKELKKQVLKLIKKSKDKGIKLGEIADELGLESWRDVLPAAQELIEGDKVEKKDSYYFAL